MTATKTGSGGKITLAKEGSFVFVTVPNTHAASGLWYRSASDTQFNFGLKSAPAEKSGNAFTFIHMTDIHLDAANLAILNKAVAEFNTISPAFIVNTGDLVNAGDPTNNASGTQTISEAQAAEWFGAYKTAMNSLAMPVFNAMGNHDAANIACESAAGATAGCSKIPYRNTFGPTYYSFGWGQYHCVVLDPNGVSAGKETFSVTGSQWQWLQADLGYRAKSSPLYETAAVFGPLILNDDLGAVAKANDLCNRYGLDTISTGAVVAFAFECFEQGVITCKETDGMELVWGNAGAMVTMVEKIGKREGFGDLLADGCRKAAERIGGDAARYALHIKGLELPMHDPRAFISWAVAYGTSNRGACHIQAPTFWVERGLTFPALGLDEPGDRFAWEGKGRLTKIFQDFCEVVESSGSASLRSTAIFALSMSFLCCAAQRDGTLNLMRS